VTQRLAPRLSTNCARVAIFVPLVAYALAVQVEWLPLLHKGFFVEFWAMFFLGALTWWTVSEEVSVRTWWALAVVMTVVAALGQDSGLGVALVTASAILLAHRTHRLSTLLRGPVVQYLGRISYSLYLVHTLVGYKPIQMLSRRFPARDALGAAVLFLGALVISVIAAHLMYVFVEQPSVRFSRRFRQSRERAPDLNPR
jgi:peptidoglycan/LPS O-acetylase OafA/YrhL